MSTQGQRGLYRRRSPAGPPACRCPPAACCRTRSSPSSSRASCDPAPQPPQVEFLPCTRRHSLFAVSFTAHWVVQVQRWVSLQFSFFIVSRGQLCDTSPAARSSATMTLLAETDESCRPQRTRRGGDASAGSYGPPAQRRALAAGHASAAGLPGRHARSHAAARARAAADGLCGAHVAYASRRPPTGDACTDGIRQWDRCCGASASA